MRDADVALNIFRTTVLTPLNVLKMHDDRATIEFLLISASVAARQQHIYDTIQSAIERCAEEVEEDTQKQLPIKKNKQSPAPPKAKEILAKLEEGEVHYIKAADLPNAKRKALADDGAGGGGKKLKLTGPSDVLVIMTASQYDAMIAQMKLAENIFRQRGFYYPSSNRHAQEPLQATLGSASAWGDRADNRWGSTSASSANPYGSSASSADPWSGWGNNASSRQRSPWWCTACNVYHDGGYWCPQWWSR